MKLLFYIIILAVLTNSCGWNAYFKQQNENQKRYFLMTKNVFKIFDFKGHIVSKRYCKKCDIQNYKYQIFVKFYSEDKDIRYAAQSHYSIESNDTLWLTVSKQIYLAAAENDSIIKKGNSNNIIINNKELILLSDKYSEWLPSEKQLK
jgi:hypothetical protein